MIMKSITHRSDIDHERRIRDLEELDKKIAKEKEEREKQEKEQFTLAQQMLILHYLDLIKKIEGSDVKKSKLLSKLLNRNKDNIRNNLSTISSPRIAHSKIKNEENLEILLELFKKLGMSKIVDRINIDIIKVKENLKLKSLQPPLH